MEKLRNSLCNDAVRGRQSTMYRAQRLAEYALYDGDPHLLILNSSHYLSHHRGSKSRSAVESFLDVENRVVLDIVPAALAEDAIETEPAASPCQPGEPQAANRASASSAGTTGRRSARLPDQ